MLNMLSRWGEMGPLTPKDLTCLTFSPVLSTKKKNVPQFHEPTLHETGEMFFFFTLKRGDMLNMLNFGGPKAPISPHLIQHI